MSGQQKRAIFQLFWWFIAKDPRRKIGKVLRIGHEYKLISQKLPQQGHHLHVYFVFFNEGNCKEGLVPISFEVFNFCPSLTWSRKTLGLRNFGNWQIRWKKNSNVPTMTFRDIFLEGKEWQRKITFQGWEECKRSCRSLHIPVSRLNRLRFARLRIKSPKT